MSDRLRVQEDGSGPSWTREVTALEPLAFLRSVIVLNCGGTIDMAGSRESAPSAAVEGVLNGLDRKAISYGISYRVRNVFARPPDSTNIGEREWDALREAIADVVSKKNAVERELREASLRSARGGIVITHGTDSLTITSQIVSYMFFGKLSLPIVFTGSYATPDSSSGSDAKVNLLKALLVAGPSLHNDGLPPGVYVVIGSDVHLATRMTKVYTEPNSEGAYFFSFPAPVGRVTGMKREKAQIHIDRKYISSLLGSRVRHFPEPVRPFGMVEHLVVQRHTSTSVLGDFLSRVLEYGIEDCERGVGVVIQGDFSGHPEIAVIRGFLKKLIEKGTTILLGAKKSFDALKLREVGLIPHSLSHTKARTKLMWLLQLGISNEEILKLVDTNIGGDVVDSVGLPEWIVYDSFPNDVVIVCPGSSPKIVRDATRRARSKPKRRERQINICGLGSGHVPTVNRPLAEVVVSYLESQPLLRECISVGSSSCEGLLESLADRLLSIPSERLQTYVEARYKVDPRIAEREMRRLGKARTLLAITADLAERMSKLERQINTRSRHGKRVSVKIQSSAIELKVRPEVASAEYDSLVERFRTGERVEFVAAMIAHFPELIARRIAKDALMCCSGMLKEIGAATDEGVLVRMRTLAVRAKTDLSLYEVGVMLSLVGAWDESGHEPETAYLVPRRDTH